MRGTSILIPVLLAVGGGVLYHVSAKSVPKELAPALVLVVAYATALSISALAHPLLSSEATATPLRLLLHPAVLGLGVGAAIIELGYVLMYRGAWPVSSASVIVGSMVTALLVPVGLLAFGEHLSLTRVVGIVLCLAGVWLLRH